MTTAPTNLAAWLALPPPDRAAALEHLRSIAHHQREMAAFRERTASAFPESGFGAEARQKRWVDVQYAAARHLDELKWQDGAVGSDDKYIPWFAPQVFDQLGNIVRRFYGSRGHEPNF